MLILAYLKFVRSEILLVVIFDVIAGKARHHRMVFRSVHVRILRARGRGGGNREKCGEQNAEAHEILRFPL